MLKIHHEIITYEDIELSISCNMAVLSAIQDAIGSISEATVEDLLWAMINDALEDVGRERQSKEDVIHKLFKTLTFNDYQDLRKNVLDMLVNSVTVKSPDEIPGEEGSKNVETALEK